MDLLVVSQTIEDVDLSILICPNAKDKEKVDKERLDYISNMEKQYNALWRRKEVEDQIAHAQSEADRKEAHKAA
uniref:Uncharacterized protein n=1 Tax=Cannabis sativa TaxID=3483 RepID=A0A803PUI2_CANSA